MVALLATAEQVLRDLPRKHEHLLTKKLLHFSDTALVTDRAVRAPEMSPLVTISLTRAPPAIALVVVVQVRVPFVDIPYGLRYISFTMYHPFDYSGDKDSHPGKK